MFEYIDHIVYAVHDLHKAIIYFENETGIKVQEGGRHINHGTHNALIKIGERSYLEFIAKDPMLSSPVAGTWMGLDHLQKDKITRWSLASRNIDADAQIINQYNNRLGLIKEGSRKKSDGTMLYWQMSNVLPDPEIDVIPFLLDWKDSEHPTTGIPLECKIIDFRIFSPNQQKTKTLFQNLAFKNEVGKRSALGLELVLETPKGIFELA